MLYSVKIRNLGLFLTNKMFDWHFCMFTYAQICMYIYREYACVFLCIYLYPFSINYLLYFIDLYLFFFLIYIFILEVNNKKTKPLCS